MVPRTVLTRSGLILVNAARPVNTVQSRTTVNNAGPMKNVINNAYSTARRPFNKITGANNSNFTKKVNTIKGTRVNTARSKAVLSAVKGNKGNVVKALACWVWRPKHKVLDHGNPQQDLKDKVVIDSGCSRHMIGNRSYLTDYEEINGGFVAFGGNSKGGKITGKGTKVCDDVGKTRMETIPGKDYILLPLWTQDPPFSSSSKDSPNAGFKPSGEVKKKDTEDPGNESGNPTEGKDSEVLSTEEPRINQEKVDNINITNNINTSSGGNNTNNVNAVSSTINVAGSKVNVVDPKTSIELLNDLNMPELEDIVYSDNDEDVGVEADMNNLDAFMPLFLAYASFKDSVVYQMDVKSAFLYAKIEEEVHVFQPPRFEDPNFPDRVYKVEKALYGLHQAPRACRRKIGFLSQDKYVTKILKKFGLSDVKIASTPMETQKPLLKDAGGEDVDEHLYRSMIGSLMYLTSLRPDIMFTVCGCARFQANPKSSHLYAVKRIFRYM
ncbi:retrovirus-related pol polyprotein from transposon TNT 1-94 [Tanacetum coccineum]